jgi:sulfate adenylyltransferase
MCRRKCQRIRNIVNLSAAEAAADRPRNDLLSDSTSSSLAARERRAAAARLPAWDLGPHQLCDLELLLAGGFAPLSGFLGEKDYRAVLAGSRLADGRLWPMPICLDLPAAVADALAPGDRLALRHPEGVPLAVLTIDSLFRPDKEEEAAAILGTTDRAHPWVAHLADEVAEVYAGGTLEPLEPPPHAIFRAFRHTPAQLKAIFAAAGWQRVVAFQTRNPLHRAHVELVSRAAARADAAILLHPVVGRTQPGDVDDFTRVACYRAVLPRFAPRPAMLSLLPLAMRMAGPREALWHALIRKNYGATHFVVGRDHASPGPFYEPYAAQQLVAQHAAEIGIEALPFEELVYRPDEGVYVGRSEVPAGAPVASLSGSELRRRLRAGEALPDFFTYPEVEAELRRRVRPRSELGFAVFFTGLSGAGKSTIAGVLLAMLEERGPRGVTLLDGDVVRRHLSSELGFSRQHRDLNVTRIGFVAAEIVKHGGVAICAPIAPYAAARRQARAMIEAQGGFVEVYVETPLETCEQRDRKGLYAKARAGLVKGFTGIDDPYEAPQNAEIVVDTRSESAEEAAERIVAYLAAQGYLKAQIKEG